MRSIFVTIKKIRFVGRRVELWFEEDVLPTMNGTEKGYHLSTRGVVFNFQINQAGLEEHVDNYGVVGLKTYWDLDDDSNWILKKIEKKDSLLIRTNKHIADIKDIYSIFKHGDVRYHTNPMFRQVVERLYQKEDVITVLDNVLRVVDDYKEVLKKIVISSTGSLFTTEEVREDLRDKLKPDVKVECEWVGLMQIGYVVSVDRNYVKVRTHDGKIMGEYHLDNIKIVE